MKKLPVSVPASLIAVATLAACGGASNYERVSAAPTVTMVTPQPVVTYPGVIYPGGVAVVPAGGVVVTTTAVLRPGFGRIESMATVIDTNGAVTGMRRLILRMDDGSVQVVDTRGPNIALGERVEITSERYIRYPVASR